MFITIFIALAFAIVGCIFGAAGAMFGAVIGLVIGSYIGFGECEGPVSRVFFAPRPKADEVPVLTEAV